ncbi:TonB-dependent receptor [Alloacidobacterium dinghuense]|uniref:TonB-dependent receptor n=1 Tax=Alloacidobacterium dinghuense TaxID=2763107 RepID=A0A7G8BDP6_9BACT|nr:TonB-dependent receptor [Alloacidobacterium dinghuense]QNI30666.1 TonB-dependent receptor [Alloacidobacterium dinghuense]
MLRSWLGRFSQLLFITSLMAGSGFAQTDTARIQGTVTDPTGAVVPNATITVTNTDQGRSFAATSDGSGNFTVSGLTRGNYSIKVDASGFTSIEQSISLDVSQVRAIDLKLQPGGTSQTVTVTDTASLIDLASSSTGEVIKGRQVTQLPLNGRNFTALALLTPGVTRGNYNDQANGSGGNVETFRYNDSGGAALSVNGLRPQSNNFILDGTDNNESLVNTIVFFTPIDATDEFRVNTSVAPAEFGRAGGAIVESSIKSGTNQIHGSAFDFLRNSEFDANPNYQFLGAGFSKFPNFIRNQFGGSLGMPILRNKLFIFGDYQGLREKTGLAPSFQTVPTARMRQGDFSELLAPGNQNLTTVPQCAVPAGQSSPASTGQIYDPITCQPFTGNIIPQNRWNQAAVNYFNAFPAPTNPNLIQGNYEAIQQQITSFNDFDVRLDFTPTAKDQFFVRYSYGQDNFTKSSLFPNLPAGFATGQNQSHPRAAVGSYTRIITPNLLNEFRVAYVRPEFGYIPPFFGDPVSQNLGIVNANRNQLTSGGALIGDNNSQLSYTGDGGPYLVKEYTAQGLDAVSWNHGAHAFKFGVNIINRRVNFFQGNDSKGFFNFVSAGSGDPNWTGYDVSEALVGFSNYSLGASSDFFGTYNWETGYFAQDDWKVTRRLTLNLGLRYDLYTYPYTAHNQQSTFDILTGQLLVAGQNGQSRSQVNTNHNNFAPRVGFAYDLFGNGNSVLRGGYGIFYFLDRGGIGNQLSNNPDFNGTASYNVNNGYRVTFTGQGPSGSNDSRLATAALPAPASTVDITNPQNVSVIAQLPNNQTSTIQQWNLQLQQQIGQSAFTMAYVGTRATHLTTAYNLNQQPLGYLGYANGFRLYPVLGGAATVNNNSGVSSYNGLQLHFEHRFTKGLTTTASYTWAHTTDDSVSPLGNESNQIFINPATHSAMLNLNKGNSYQDQRHVFNFSTLYDLPFGKGHEFFSNVSRPVNYVVGGWQMNMIAQLNTGVPFDVIDSHNAPTDFADLVAPAVITHSVTRSYFSTSSFAEPANVNGIYSNPGTAGRGLLHGPGTKVVNFALQKNIPITERVNTEFRTEAFNIFNTPQFTNPDGNLNDQNFGLISGLQYNSVRQIQFALRFTF